jgi:hypothetical protein
MAEKPRGQGRNAAILGGGLGSGIVIAWAWNLALPDSPMPPEVASAIGGGLMLVAGWINRTVDRLVDQ